MLGLTDDELDAHALASTAVIVALYVTWFEAWRIAARVTGHVATRLTGRVRDEMLWWLASGGADSAGRRYVAERAAAGDVAAQRAMRSAGSIN